MPAYCTAVVVLLICFEGSDSRFLVFILFMTPCSNHRISLSPSTQTHCSDLSSSRQDNIRIPRPPHPVVQFGTFKLSCSLFIVLIPFYVVLYHRYQVRQLSLFLQNLLTIRFSAGIIFMSGTVVSWPFMVQAARKLESFILCIS